MSAGGRIKIGNGDNITFLNVYTDGDGGIGKTQFLFNIQRDCGAPLETFFSRNSLIFITLKAELRLALCGRMLEGLGKGYRAFF